MNDAETCVLGVALIGVFSAFSLAPACALAQTNGANAAAQLGSANWQVRAGAFATIDQTPSRWKDSTLARKLLQLVIREDEFQKQIIRASNDTLGYGDVLGEGYSEYTAQAVDECLRYCDKEGILDMMLADARRGPTRGAAVELLGNAYSRFGFSVEQRVRMDDVMIDAASDPTSFLTRWSAVSALGPAILTGHDLPPLERQRIHRTVIGAVGDAWADVRISAIGRIAEFGDPADSALLSRIAEQDTARATSHGREVYPVRDAARRAMEDIGRVQRPAPPQGR